MNRLGNRSGAESYLGIAEGYNPRVDELMTILVKRIRAAVAANDSQSYRDSTEAVTTILVVMRFMTRAQATVCMEEVGRSRSADGVTLDRLGNTEDNMVTLMNAMMRPELNRYHYLLDHYVDAGRLL